jgi:Tfp pilus assembly protein PilE
MPRSPMTSDRGVTLFEVALMVIVSAALVFALAPSVSATVRNARRTRATLDMNKIRDAINNFKAGGFTIFTNNGSQTVANQVQYLYSDGDIPGVGSSALWRNTTAGNINDYLEQHLVTNTVGYSLAVAPIWRGTYINAPVDSDPWGNRYAVNVRYLGASANDVVVHSAGDDEEVDTSDTGNPLTVADDDIIVLVET